MKRVAVFALLAASLAAQPRALLSGREALQLCERVVQLMDSTTLAVPGLARAAAPAIENARQTLSGLRSFQNNSALTYDFLNQARGYLALADTVPKPYPFPEEARRQFAELRGAVERIDAHFRDLLEMKERSLRSPDRDNLKRYSEANEKLAPPSTDRPRVVFLGDSITDGWRLNEYFPGRDFVNRGISGQVTGEMLGRMMADVIERKPKAMLVLAGTNDLARGTPLRTIENNLAMVADLAEYHKIVPLFASVLPVSDYHRNMTAQRPPAQILELNNWLRQFCASRNFRYVDYFAVLVDKAGFIGTDLADDGLHPNAAGYRLMASVALEAIDAVLKPAPAAAVKGKRRK